MNASQDQQVEGYVDAYRDGRIVGWAWRPSAPHETLGIEVLVDGVLVAETAAWLPRADLAVAGLGDGRHGFAAIVHLDVDRLNLSRVVVRVKDGDPLPGNLHADASGAVVDETTEPEIAAFIASVLAQAPQTRRAQQGGLSVAVDAASSGTARTYRARPGVAMNFIVYSFTTTGSLTRDLGGPEYSYYFVARGFSAALARLGRVHTAADPVADVDRIYDECIARGEECLFLYCAPPHRMLLGARCPTIPVIAWEFPSIPTEVWDDEPRNDWRNVLRHTVGTIALSQFAADAVRRAMGAQYPVLAAPAAVWDRSPTKGLVAVQTPTQSTSIEIDGFVLDSRQKDFVMGVAPPPAPRRGPGEAPRTDRSTLDGVVFTSVFAPKDGRKNWTYMLTAFLTAFRDTPDATLVFKMIGPESYWWWELHDLIARMPAARCRVVVLQGYLSETSFAALMGGTHWIVNSSVAEGLCLPLLEFMSAGRPAIAPAHTAMADYLNTHNALIVRSAEDYCGWPQDVRCHFTTTRYRIEWASLRDSMQEAYRITKSDPKRYAAMGRAAFDSMRRYCAEEVVAAKIAGFIGLAA